MFDHIDRWENNLNNRNDYDDYYYVINDANQDNVCTQSDIDAYRNPYLHVSWDVVSTLPRLSNLEILPILSDLYLHSGIVPIRKMKDMVSFKSWVFLFNKCYPYLLYYWDRPLDLFSRYKDRLSKNKFYALVASFSQMIIDWSHNSKGIRWSIVALTVLSTKAFPKEPKSVYYFME